MDISLTFQHIRNLENVNFQLDECQIKNAEKKGIHLYQTDKIFRDIATFMEHPESFNFYKNYIENQDNFKFIICLMKVYEIISKILEKHNMEFNAYHKLYVLYILLKNPTYSRLIRKSIEL